MSLLFLINGAGFIACYILGLAYPAVVSIQAIESRTTVDDTQWLTYWLVYAVMTLAEAVIYPYFKWLPLYHVFKAVGIAWLVHPRTKGAAYAYERALLPVYTQSNKILLDLGEKHPELKKIPFYPQKKGVAAKLSDLKDASQ